MEPEKQEKLVAVARIGAPRGLEGYLKLKSYSGEFEHIKKLSEVILARGAAEGAGNAEKAGDTGSTGNPSRGSPQGQPKTRRAVIAGFQEGEWGLSARFEGFDSPEKARELTGLDIMVPFSAASPLAENEWYICDLVGMRVQLGSEEIGEIVGVLEGGADPLLELRISATGKTALVPFRNQFVGRIDKNAGSLELLAGWLLE
ncbi:MAG: ribosome maturation factor RimM [Spirochaetaceae bacterium]|nr:ribosome maturation factor RimM [Spirochaetaceae bacterium]